MNAGSTTLSSGVLLVLSLAVPWLARALPNALPRPTVFRPALPRAARLGLALQDLFIGSEIAVVAIAACAWLSRPWAAALACAGCVAFAHMIIAADYLIQREAGVRFAWHFLSYLRVFKCFEGSIRRSGVGLTRLLRTTCLYAAAVAAMLWWAFANWGLARMNVVGWGALGVLGLAGLLGQRLAGPAVTWEHQNIWLHLQRAALDRLLPSITFQ